MGVETLGGARKIGQAAVPAGRLVLVKLVRVPDARHGGSSDRARDA
jgi:hypothetical protein